MIAVFAALICGVVANAEVAAKQTLTITGRVVADAASGKTYRVIRVSQRDFVAIIAEDEGLELSTRELRSAKFALFDFGDGILDLFGIEFWDAELRAWILYTVEDRFFYEFQSDVAGDDFSNGGRWAAIIAIAIDLVDEDDEFSEFWGMGYFQAAVRELRRAGLNLIVPTAGLRSVGFPAVLFVEAFDEFEDIPGSLSLTLRAQVVDTDNLII
ncbi:hypothetical protein, partial [Cerasicoccus arenae]